MTEVRNDGPGRSPQPSPELVGALIAAVLVAIVALTGLAFQPSTPTPSGGSSALPSAGGPTASPTPEPIIDPAVVELLAALNDKLDASGAALDPEVTRSPFRIREVVALIRQVNLQVGPAKDAVPALKGAQGPDEVGGRLAAVYASISETATDTLRASVTNDAEYRSGAAILVKLIDGLPALQAELEALLEQPAPTASPAPASPSPSPASASPSPAPTTAPTASPSASGSAAASPAAPTGAEQVVNGGFESGVGPPWALYFREGMTASLSADARQPAAGKAAARVDVPAGSPAFSAISLRQAGLSLESGKSYALTVAVRSSAEGEVRIRVVTQDGAARMNRVESVTSTWRTVSYTFISGIRDPNGVLELDVGHAEGTVWFDSVSLRAVGG